MRNDTRVLVITSEKTVLIGDISTTFNLEISVEEDEIEDGSDFGDEAENAAYLARFSSGELFNGIVFVKASFAGIEGNDALGGCHLFTGVKLRESVIDIVDEYNIVDEAIEECIGNLLEQAQLLAPYIK